ncbi:MFS transporter [Nocardia stercoris]|uniref:DHA2 family efflux MFS transporter permease subunit n=1 Tax=Nocardia stercoris TaxID=2483361 RepID=A0A3M2LDR1_9NOCA|nr:MFS transporter [Nocardia stercoris]RMI34900.1 DHA2 family efflux MFS transporter permease subunit [Nocardia stercoris]
MSTTLDPVLETETPDEKPSRTAWLVALTTIGASLMDLLDATVTSTAGPSIQRDFHTSTSALQWMIAAYTLTFSVMLIAGGRLGDVVGRRRMFTIGLVGFIASSVACSLAQSADVLIGTRAVQGAFAAVMIPQGLGLIRAVFPPGKVSQAFAMMGPVMGMGAMAGPILGGLLVDTLGWRSIFWINVPVGLLALAGAILVLPRDHEQPGHKPKLDIVGLILASASLFLLVFPIVQGREANWAPWTWIMMGATVPALAIFALHQWLRHRAGRDPFIEPTLFRKRAFNAGLIVVLLFNAGFIGTGILGTLLMQYGLGFSPLHSGLTQLWFMLGTMLSMGIAQKFAPAHPRRVLQSGLALLAVGAAASALTVRHFGADLNSLTVGPALLVAGFGVGLCFTPIFGVILAAVDDREIGSASGLVNSFDQLGGGIGVAVLGTLFFDRAAEHGLFGAAEYSYWIAGAALVCTWAIAFFVPRTARSEDQLY